MVTNNRWSSRFIEVEALVCSTCSKESSATDLLVAILEELGFEVGDEIPTALNAAIFDWGGMSGAGFTAEEKYDAVQSVLRQYHSTELEAVFLP